MGSFCRKARPSGAPRTGRGCLADAPHCSVHCSSLLFAPAECRANRTKPRGARRNSSSGSRRPHCYFIVINNGRPVHLLPSSRCQTARSAVAATRVFLARTARDRRPSGPSPGGRFLIANLCSIITLRSQYRSQLVADRAGAQAGCRHAEVACAGPAGAARLRGGAYSPGALHDQAGPALLLAFHVLSVSARRFRRAIRDRLGHGAEPPVGRRAKPRPLSGIYRPARLCRRDRLRRHGAQRASSEHLWSDAVAQSDRRGAVAADQARQDRHSRQPAAAASQPAAHGGGIRHARQHVGWPPDRRLCAGVGTGDVQLRCALGALARAILGGRRSHPPRLDRGRAVCVGRPPLSPALRQSVAAADAAAASPGLDPELALDRDLGQHRQARILLFPLLAQPRQRNGEVAGAVRQGARRAGQPLRSLQDGYPHVRPCRRHRCAGAGRSQGRRLVLPQELPQGTPAARRPHAHRRAGHSLHSPVRIPQLSEILRSQRAAARRRRELERPAARRNRSSSAARTRSIAASSRSSSTPSAATC